MIVQGLIILLLSAMLSAPVHAGVLQQNEWESVTQAGWSYSRGYSGQGALIDPAPDGGSSPSGGGALRMVLPSGMPGGVGGGTASYDALSGQSELFVGFWLKHSTNFVWHPICSKFYYQVMDGPDIGGSFTENFYTCVKPGGTGIQLAPQLQQPPGTQGYNSIAGAVNVTPLNVWRWFEFHTRLNTVGKSDGLIELFINDVLVLTSSTVTFRSNNRFIGHPQMNATWGGSGSTVPATQYMWFDHTVISTTRIGMPGGTFVDTTPPGPVLNFTVN